MPADTEVAVERMSEESFCRVFEGLPSGRQPKRE